MINESSTLPWFALDNNKKIRATKSSYVNAWWFVDSNGNYCFKAFSNAKPKAKLRKPELTGMDTDIAIDDESVILRLRNKHNASLFYSLCKDIIGKIESLDYYTHSTILERIDKWQKFLKKSNDGLLSTEKIKGLIGELYFINSYLCDCKGFTAAEAIEFWTGPLGSNQDFCLSDAAFEIKCKTGTSHPKIKISSETQLDKLLDKLYLYVLVISPARSYDEGIESLPELIEKIKSKLIDSGSIEKIDEFEEKLLSIGYIYNEKYDDHKFILSSGTFYIVNDSFPKISRQEVPRCISDVTYSINLDDISSFIINESELML
ncbi:hypothetical protein JCM19231_1546 [Vibrio ishigakensis]|uniref:PD-(D/E)XK motif protein n=2 Tax=Vibrio ishigakensis TaxID=1481914 RepID=A0A0B8NUF1_9VIBR|nr:hypothetical protein JCM19231_1546 [Vibrio ishigakensis]